MPRVGQSILRRTRCGSRARAKPDTRDTRPDVRACIATLPHCYNVGHIVAIGGNPASPLSPGSTL